MSIYSVCDVCLSSVEIGHEKYHKCERLSKEREAEIRERVGRSMEWICEKELLSEIDALRKDYLELTEVLRGFISKQEQLESKHRK